MSGKINREAVIAKLLAREELRKRQLRAKPAYVPNAGQLPMHLSAAKERYNFSGNGSGKTTGMVNELMWALQGFNPVTKKRTRVPSKVILVVDNTRKIEEKIIPELKKWFEIKDSWLKRMGKPYTSQIALDNGSVCDIYSYEADPGSFEGVEASHVFIDEPVRKKLWVALKRSLRLKGHPCKLYFCGTAIDQAWLRRDIYEPWSKGELEGVECFRTGTEVNEDNLEEGYIKSFSQGLSESEKEVRLKGGFFDSDALALAHLWDRKKHIIPADSFKYDPMMPCVVAVDCHSVKPHTAVLLTANPDGQLIVVKELRLRATASQFAAALTPWVKGYSVLDIVCDSLGNMEGTAFEGFESFIDGFNKAPVKPSVRMRATRFQEKDHEDLVDRLRQGLVVPDQPDNFGRQEPKLKVVSHCKGTISDFEGATWQKNRITGEMRPKIDTSTLDFLAPLGYALATNLFFNKRAACKPVYTVSNYYGVAKSEPAAAQNTKYKGDPRGWWKD